MKNEFGNAIQFETLLGIVDFFKEVLVCVFKAFLSFKLTINGSRENACLMVASDFVGSYIALLWHGFYIVWFCELCWNASIFSHFAQFVQFCALHNQHFRWSKMNSEKSRQETSLIEQMWSINLTYSKCPSFSFLLPHQIDCCRTVSRMKVTPCCESKNNKNARFKKSPWERTKKIKRNRDDKCDRWGKEISSLHNTMREAELWWDTNYE